MEMGWGVSTSCAMCPPAMFHTSFHMQKCWSRRLDIVISMVGLWKGRGAAARDQAALACCKVETKAEQNLSGRKVICKSDLEE